MAEMRFVDAKRGALAGILPVNEGDVGVYVSMDDLLVHMEEMKDVLDQSNVAFTFPSQVIEAIRIQLRSVMLDAAGIIGEHTV